MWWRTQFPGARQVGSTRVTQVIEPELDMNRPKLCPSVFQVNLSKLVRWLTPESRAIGAPMRSIARELEEAFPTSDY